VFEDFYLDISAVDPELPLRYVRLLEQLRAAEAAKQTHDAMTSRVSHILQQKIDQAKNELEDEVGRLRKLMETRQK
jgi:hypothetical protein